MKFIASIIVTALVSYAAGFFFPWWSIAIAAFIVSALIPQKPFFAFLSGFIALFLLWGGLALFMDMKNEHILSAKIAEILFKTSSGTLLILVTGFVGGLVAGLAALTGSFVRKL